MKREAMERVIDFIKETSGYTIDSIERRSDPPIFEDDIILRIEIDMGKKIKHTVILNDVMELEGVHYVEEIG